MKWGLRLSYIFSTRDQGIPEILKDKLEQVTERYFDDSKNGHIEYTTIGDVGPTNYKGGLKYSSLSQVPGVSFYDGAPKCVSVEVTRAKIYPENSEIDMKVYSIPFMEAEKNIHETSIINLPIYNPLAGADGGEQLWPGRWLQTFYQEAYEDLKQEITSSEKYAAVFDYTFPFRRYLGINTINVIMAMRKIGPGPLMYAGTRDILTSMLRGATEGTGEDSYEYKDPQLAALGNTAGMFSDSINSENFKPKKINLAAMVLKLFLETPLKILKGLVEAFDPNITLIKTIIDILKTIVSQLPEIAPECIVEQAVSVAVQGVTNEAEKGQIAKETREDLNRQYKEIKQKLKNILDDLPVPLISILMLPSMLPFGCGFPPPPFGFGVGPPLTPFGVAYLVLGLYRDGNLMTTPDTGKRDNPGDLADNLNPDLEALCKEKLEKYQEIAALGLIDAEADEEDTD